MPSRSAAAPLNTQGGNCGIGLSGGAQFKFLTVTSTTQFGPPQPPVEGGLWFIYPGYDIPTTVANMGSGGTFSMGIGQTNVNGIFTEVSASIRDVPEPTTILLNVIGMVAVWRRRR